MKINAPCPGCGHSPVDMLDLIDGELWICPGCGYVETGAGVDVEAQMDALTQYDPRLAAGWRVLLGI